MSAHFQEINPNAAADAPVIKQIFAVLVGFAVITAVIAVTINIII
jgi:hypothetical protein